tara:strand:+ start:611 stop:1717 length:1107 start_codon:yes stop_codon:yes gene_type:complete
MSLINPLGIQTTAGRPAPPRRRSIAGELAEFGGKTLIGLGATAGTELIKAGMGKGSALQDALVSDRVKAQQAEQQRLDRLTALSPAVVAQTQARARIADQAMSQGGQTERREMQEAGSTERLKLRLDAQEKMDNINIEAKRFSMEMQRYNAGLDSKFGKKRKGAKGIPRGIQKGFDDARSRQAEMLKKAEETRDPVLRQSYLQEGRRAYERMMQFQKMIDDRFGIKSPDKTDFKSGEMPPPKTDEKTEAQIRRLDAQTRQAEEAANLSRARARQIGTPEADNLQRVHDNIIAEVNTLKDSRRKEDIRKRGELLREAEEVRIQINELPLGGAVPAGGTSGRAGTGSARNLEAIKGLVTPVNNPTPPVMN